MMLNINHVRHFHFIDSSLRPNGNHVLNKINLMVLAGASRAGGVVIVWIICGYGRLRSVTNFQCSEGPVSKFAFFAGNYRMRCNYHRPEFEIKILKLNVCFVAYIFNVKSAFARHKFCMFVCLAYKQEIMNLWGPIPRVPLGRIEKNFFVLYF